MPRLTELQRLEVISAYTSGIGSSTIAKRFGVSKPSILGLLRRRGIERREHGEAQRIKHRKYYNNDTYFDLIDSQEKAYVLGFFAADGCNFPKSNNVNFTCCDIDVLEKIAGAMGVDCPIKAPRPAKSHYKPCYVLRLKSAHMCASLERLGFGPRKSQTCGWPKIPENLYRHFIRGYFDGDGSVGFSTYKGHIMPQVSFSGSELMLRRLSVESEFWMSITKEPGIYGAKMSSHDAVRQFYNYLYDESTIHMERKYKRYTEVLGNLR